MTAKSRSTWLKTVPALHGASRRLAFARVLKIRNPLFMLRDAWALFRVSQFICTSDL